MPLALPATNDTKNSSFFPSFSPLFVIFAHHLLSQLLYVVVFVIGHGQCTNIYFADD